MNIEPDNRRHDIESPSAWVCRWRLLIPCGGRVLDVAAGNGRHARYLAGFGYRIDAVDRDAARLRAVDGTPGISTLCFDLEAGVWPYATGLFSGVIVTNYLHRPLFAHLMEALIPGGALIYDTFAAGNEKYGRPSRAEYLLQPGELLQLAGGRMEVVAYENLLESVPRPAVKQRICAVNRVSGWRAA